MHNQKAHLHGTIGAENYFGDVTKWDFGTPLGEDGRETPSLQVAQRERFPSCRNAPNSISCKDPQMNVGKDPAYLPYLSNLAKWFYNGYEQITIGDPDPVLKYSYSVGNYNETKRNWGDDTLAWKEQMGGRYDGKTRYPQEDTGYEDWWHEYPERDFSQVWLRYNKGDEEIQDFLLQRWLGDQESDWPGTDLGISPNVPAEGPAFPVEYELQKARYPALIRDASLKNIILSLNKIAQYMRED